MFMKNTNSNGWNVVINNVPVLYLFFPKKYWELNKIYLGLQSLFLSRDSITTHKLGESITPPNFGFTKQNGMI